MANYSELCTAILAGVGGKDNIKSAVHCMTRLRITPKNKEAINVDEVKAVKGVLGAQFSGDQFQVIIGQQVSDVYPEFCALAGIGASAAIDENLDAKEPFDIKKVPSKILDYISGSLAPVIPIMMAAGFFKMFYALLGPSLLNVCDESSNLMQTFYIIGQCGFYFMPVFVAWGASKKLNTNTALALLLGVLLIDPNILNLVTTGDPFKIFGLINIPLNNYSQTVIPALLTIWILKYVYNFFNKHIPTSVKVIGVPFLTAMVMLPVMFCALAPLGNWIGLGFAAAITFLSTTTGPFCIAIIGAFWMFLVATGMHIAVIQIALMNMMTFGYDPVILAGSNISNYALMGMAVAYFLRTKGEEKQLASANAITLLVGGISEPTLFAVLLRNKYAMACEIIGGGIGGLIGGFLGVKVYVFATANFLNVLAYTGPDNNLLYACIACGVAFVVSLVTGLIIGFGTPDEGAGLKNFKGRPKKVKATA